MRIFFLFAVLSAAVCSCRQPGGLKKVDQAWLDSIIKASDSTYSKPYFRTDFVTAEYYVNNKDSSVCQLMKDSAGTIRQISIAKKGVRTFFAKYYDNGQIQADLPLDGFGQYHGFVTNYYRSGKIESSGNYVHGLRKGEFKNFDAEGRVVSIEKYGSNGELLQ